MKHMSQAVKVGLLGVFVVVSGWIIYGFIGQRVGGEGQQILMADFEDAAGVPEGSAVVIAGLPVGQIESWSIEGGYARVRMKLRDDIQVFSNAVVYKKSTSLLGAYYLEISPGKPRTVGPDGKVIVNKRLVSGDVIHNVVEATSPEKLMTQISLTLPKVDEVLVSVRDLTQDIRRIVNGPVDSMASRLDQLVQKEAETISVILGRVEGITRDVKGATDGIDDRINQILRNLNEASAGATTLINSAQSEVEQTGVKIREKLELVDDFLASSASIASKIDNDKGTLGRLVNDSTLANNLEDVTEDAKEFLGSLFRMQTYVGLRTEYNIYSQLTRTYVTLELATRPDKFYYVELSKGPRGSAPDVTLEFDPTVDRSRWVRKIEIDGGIRFTLQYGRRYKWASLRYGIKESTGGVGFDGSWFNDRLNMSIDLFEASFDELPRMKISAAYRLFEYLYIIGGVDDALNNPEELLIDTGDITVPETLEALRFGRDYFVGAMLRFNDRDLAALLTVGGSAATGVTGD